MKKIASLFLAILTLVLSVNIASAQVGNLDSVTLTAIPPRLGDDGDIFIKPGEKFQTSVRVTNNSEKNLDVESFVQDFIIGDDGFTPIPVKEGNNRWSLAEWVTLTPSNQTLKPRETGVVNVLIEVPEDALPGGHFAIITHQPAIGRVEAGAGNSTSGVTQRVGTLLYVRVDGDIKESAFIHDFRFKPDIAEFGPMNFFYELENQSDVHIKPAASVEMFNMFGKKVADLQVEPNNVFPGAKRSFTGVWSVSWGFGPYKAVLTVPYGTMGGVATATTTVWLLPLSIIIATLILILAIVTSVVVIKRHLAYRVELAKKEMALNNSTSAKSTGDDTQPNDPKETA